MTDNRSDRSRFAKQNQNPINAFKEPRFEQYTPQNVEQS